MTALLIATPSMKKVYQYEKYFLTDEVDATPIPGYLAEFNVSNEEVEMIADGAILLVRGDDLVLIDDKADELQEQIIAQKL